MCLTRSTPLGLLVLVTLMLLSGCTTGSRIERCSYGQFPDAYRLSNGDVEAIVVPSISRVVRYAPPGEPNVLWENPVAVETKKLIGWNNYGGDKMWLGPQSTWKERSGSPYVPPEAPYSTAEVRGNTLVLTSAEMPKYNLRVIREISLSPRGTELRIVNHLEVVDPQRPYTPAFLWSVTQVPAPPQVFARPMPGATPPWSQQISSNPAWPEPTLDDGWLVFSRDPKLNAEVAVPAEEVAVHQTGRRFAIRGVNLQKTQPPPMHLFVSADGASYVPATLPAYLELEFTSPTATSREMLPQLEVRWTLEPSSGPPNSVSGKSSR